jgi:hypothetical protein
LIFPDAHKTMLIACEHSVDQAFSTFFEISR